MTWRIHRLSVLVLASTLALAWSTSSQAQYFGQNRVQHRTFDMRVLKTEHFDIYYYPEEEQAVRHAARMAERWNSRLARMLDFKLPDRQPLILYASAPDFQQTNTLGGQEPGEGTGGVTEAFKRRVILPFAGSLGETDHVLGHELVHAFQYAMSSRKITGSLEPPAIARMPLWFVEGMAEYLSVGPIDPHTAMWMRDAVARNKLPAIKDLEKSKYFPYRWGQAFWAYVAGRWGDPVVGRILQAASRSSGDAKTAIQRTLGVKLDVLSKEWHESLRQAYQPLIERTRGDELKPLLGAAGRGRMNLSPAVSPDGQQVVFLSEKGVFSIEMYLADTRSGEVRRRMSNAAANPNIDSLMFIYSAGAWDFAGRRFVHAVVDRGRPALVVRDVASNRVEQQIALPKLGEVYNPTWSPDGKRVAFSALTGGFTDLYVYDLETKQTTRLTDDAYADLQPAWSPDGKTIAFVTDRFSSDLAQLRFGNYRLALIDPTTKDITPLVTFAQSKSINPQWSKDGDSIFFVSDREGVSNVYRLERASGALFQVTDLATGVSGITALSPALSSAAGTARLTFTAYQADRYALYTLDDVAKLAGKPVVGEGGSRAFGQLPPEERSYDQVATLKGDAGFGLPATGDFRLTPYRPKLVLDYISQPYIAAGLDRFGSFVGGGTSLSFSDMLGDHNLNLTFQASGGFSDIALLTSYANMRSRLNWGVFAGQVPYAYGSYAAGYLPDGSYQEIEYIYREINRQVGAMATYPFSRAQRVEGMAGYRRVSFEQETRTTTANALSGVIQDYQSEKSSVAPALNLVEGSVALVYDTSIFGPTSPLLGRAYRLEAGGVGGSLHYQTLLGDVRQYVMPLRPFTLATRLLFYGRFGSGANDGRLNSLYLGYPGLVRGYDVDSFSVEECEAEAGTCTILDRIAGTKLFVGNAELRFPLLGLFGTESYFGPFPIEGAVFVDGGAAWASGGVPKLIGEGHQSVWSVGAALRLNLFGLAVVEIDRVKPLDRPQKKAFWQFSLAPGF